MATKDLENPRKPCEYLDMIGDMGLTTNFESFGNKLQKCSARASIYDFPKMFAWLCPWAILNVQIPIPCNEVYAILQSGQDKFTQ